MDQRKGGTTHRFRISVPEKTELDSTVNVEGGDITQLIIEGTWRVIASRNSISNNMTSHITRPNQPKEEAVNIRFVDRETMLLHTIASAEGCSISDLVGEGIWHVINDRKQDRQYQMAAERVRALLSELEIARANLHPQA